MRLSREVNLFFGKSQSGKSTLLNELLYNHSRVLIYDFKNRLDAELRTNDLRKVFLHCKDRAFFRVCVSDPLQFPALCALAGMLRDCVFVIDEIQTVVAGTRQLNEALQRLVFVGTKNRISLYIATQRPMRLHTDIRSQYTAAYLFTQGEPSDVRWIHGTMGKQVAQDVQQLQPRHYIRASWTGDIERGKTMLSRKGVN